MAKLLVGLGQVVGLVATAALLWQMRPGTHRYQATYAGEVEWKKLQRDQWLTALLVFLSLALQLLGTIFA